MEMSQNWGPLRYWEDGRAWQFRQGANPRAMMLV